ncbi:MAG: hypothetical protein ABI602_00600 [Candidatus Saccharibacteria bacterium]
MNKLFVKTSSLIITMLAISIFSGGAAWAAKPAATTLTLLGNDISWPQCNKTLPKGQAFGIVGVNGGLANNTNPCLATQLAWAARSTGTTGQPRVGLYVNTANPGFTGSWWPTSDTYRGDIVTNPYGTCTGGDDVACAYMYGYAKAYDDVTDRGVTNPTTYRWWLDVETINSWEANTAANAADLEGMTAYFQSIGASVGLYSTSYQWGHIVGQVSDTSNLTNLKSWLPGARSANSAKANCSAAPLTAGSTVTLTQYVSGSLDYDYSCL